MCKNNCRTIHTIIGGSENPDCEPVPADINLICFHHLRFTPSTNLPVGSGAGQQAQPACGLPPTFFHWQISAGRKLP
jgi:hypothetical protein